MKITGSEEQAGAPGIAKQLISAQLLALKAAISPLMLHAGMTLPISILDSINLRQSLVTCVLFSGNVMPLTQGRLMEHAVQGRLMEHAVLMTMCCPWLQAWMTACQQPTVHLSQSAAGLWQQPLHAIC